MNTHHVDLSPARLSGPESGVHSLVRPVPAPACDGRPIVRFHQSDRGLIELLLDGTPFHSVSVAWR